MTQSQSHPVSTPTDDVQWTMLDRDELCDAYWEHIAPAIADDGHDPMQHRPTHQWLHDNGFSSILYTLREHHDLTFSEFWADVLDLGHDDDGYNWEITDEDTIKLLEAYLNSLRNRGELAESTVRTRRYRLAAYVRAYAAENEHDAVLDPVDPGSETPEYEAVDECWSAFDRLHGELDSNRTKERIHMTVDDWYSHLVRRKRAAFNPADGLDEEFRWEHEESGNPPLAPEHVQALYTAAENTEERLLVVALAAWGLRSGEVASLHRSQFVIEEDDTPYLAFEERKNGPGEVSILYGLSAYTDRVDDLVEQGSWNGYLFPSSSSENGHVVRQTIRNRFHALAERADIPSAIDGERPVPQMARRFWYDAYSAVLEGILEGLDPIADEQGSSDPVVVFREYLSDERNRKLRREQMRQRLSAAFGDLDDEPPETE